MNDDRFQKIITDLKKISLTDKERDLLRSDFMTRKKSPPLESFNFKSPYWNWSNMFVSRRIEMVVTSLAIVLIFGGSITFASKNSLPGQLLYPVKTKIYEGILRSFQDNTLSEQAEFEVNLVDTRLDEAEKLDQKQALNDGTKAEVKQGVTDQTLKAQAAIDDSDRSENGKNNKKEAGNIQISVEVKPALDALASSTGATSTDMEDSDTNSQPRAVQSSPADTQNGETNKVKLDKVLEKHSEIIHKLDNPSKGSDKSLPQL